MKMIPPDEKKWLVVYTKPRTEKKVAERLKNLGIEVYCPVVKTIRQWSDRKKKVEIPLFTSYVFVYLEDRNRNRVFETDGVVRYLFWLGKPAIVKQSEIDTIREWLDEKEVENIEMTDIRKGDTVVIETGMFKDEIGTVDNISRQFVTLTIESLGWQLRIYYRDLKKLEAGSGKREEN